GHRSPPHPTRILRLPRKPESRRAPPRAARSRQQRCVAERSAFHDEPPFVPVTGPPGLSPVAPRTARTARRRRSATTSVNPSAAKRKNLGRLARLLGVAARLAELGQPAHRLGELARDDPDLVGLALRELREHLQVLV